MGVRTPLREQQRRITDDEDGVVGEVVEVVEVTGFGARLGEPGLEFYFQGTDFWENRPVEKVDITDADNLTVTVFFDQFSKLPVRQVFRRRNPQYKDFDTEVSVFAKYRDVGGGVKWPFDVRRDRNGEKVFEMYADSVQINRNLTDELFTLPATLKILPKAR